MAADDREARHDVTVAQVLVGVAQAGSHPADQHLPLLGLVEVQLGDLPIATGIPQHGCPGLHELLLRVTATPRSYPACRLPRAALGALGGQRFAVDAFAR